MSGKREDYMEVGSREQFLATRFDPTVAGSRATHWTMPIASAVIRDGGPMPAAGALGEMTAESGGGAPKRHYIATDWYGIALSGR
jgi:hypothetical protein